MQSIHEIHRPVNRPEKILQYGEGNFLRAFADWMVDLANEKASFNGNIVMVQPLENGMSDQINRQQGLYTTVLRGVQDGRTVEELRLVNSVSRCLNAYTDYQAYLRCAENPDLRFVISNTTEAGIAWSAADRAGDQPQASFPGKITAFLAHRFAHFKGEPSKGLVFLPCELIDKNGDKLKEYVLRHADAWQLGQDFRDWVLEACTFCNSLVDRIVPGFPEDEADLICTKLGYADRLLDAAEVFHLWVIESPQDFSQELPLAQAGLNVIWTDDMSFYRTRKVRILNGAHTMGVAVAWLYGLETVEDCIKDPSVSAFIKRGIFEEIIPSMEGDSGELEQYAQAVLERFANPYIKHLLLSISLNSVSKFRTRVLPSLLDYISKTGRVPKALAFSLAALIAFYESKEPKNSQMTGYRKGQAYPIKDDQPVLERFAAMYAEFCNGGDSEIGGKPGKGKVDKEGNSGKASRLVRAVLSESQWWGEDLCCQPGLEATVKNSLENIWNLGMPKALEAIIN